MRRCLTLSLLMWGAACQGTTLPPAGQIAIQIDTDAFISPVDGPHLFDTLRVDVYAPDATVPCAACGRTFTVTSEQFVALGVSFGVSPQPNVSGYRARIRLYPARATESGDPPPPRRDGSPPTSVIETVVALPSVGVDGIVEGRVLLPTATVGMPVGTLDRPVPLDRGRLASSAVDTWSGGARVPCNGVARRGEVCVPGGAFFMGNARLRRQPVNDDLRLTVLSPFFLDATNATVAMFRLENFTPERVAGGGTGGNPVDFCTYTTLPGANEQLPVNCLSYTTAQAHCENRQSTLPTEAQFEYVAGALQGWSFPWGQDPVVTCEDVALGRVGWGLFSDVTGYCSPPMPLGGPLDVGTAKLDRLTLPDGNVAYDLAGNMMTWTVDLWNRIDEPCWSHGGVFVDPRCDTPSSDGTGHVAKGGGWYDPYPALSANRLFIAASSAVTLQTGVRCARPAK